MSLWKQPRPRGFHHEFIYVDERKERLRKIEERAKEELGQGKSSANRMELPKDVFNLSVRNAARRQAKVLQGHVFLNVFLLAVILMILMIVLVYLM